MSDSCQASSPFVLHSVSPPGGEVGLHIHATREEHDGENEATDHLTLLPNECAPYFAVKSAIDRLITATLMVVALPIMLVVGLAIILVDGQPVFYRQTRVGKNGRIFRIWKFRTMCRNAERATGAVWSSESDPRVTALGHWLRCSHLDELPQFFNILAGDMNLIGPRPERPEFVGKLAVELRGYHERHSVRPGITGLAQLRLGYDQSLTDVKRKVLLDTQYIRTASFFQDVGILLVTIPYIGKQLIGKWKADLRASSDARGLGAVVSRANGVSARNHRHEPPSREFKPHISCLSDISTGPRPSSLDARPSPLALTMDGVVGADENRAIIVRRRSNRSAAS